MDALVAMPIKRNENMIHKRSNFRHFLQFLLLLILADAALFLCNGNLGFLVPTINKNMFTFTIYRYAPYASLQEQQNRSNRFPSVETRVQFYMSHWYAPPCLEDGHVTAKIKYQLLSYNSTTRRKIVVLQVMMKPTNNNTNQSLLFQVESSTKSGHMFLLDSASLYQQEQETKNGQPDFVLHYYADDAFNSILPLMDEYLNGTPLLTQWGDSETSAIGMYYAGDAVGGRSRRVTNPALPHLKKIRAVFDSQKDLERVTAPACYGSDSVRPLARGRLQPILWKLNSRRHFQSLPRVAWNDISWDRKVGKAVFRAGFTGSKHRPGLKRSDADVCMAIERCRLVLLAGKLQSPIVDAGLTSMGRSGLNATIEGVNVVRSKLSMKAQLRCKAIIMLEGNDVASGLKWALLSNSVVIMRPPTVTSWAMEELLEPWVHYIPLDLDLTDIVGKVQWVLDHDEEARQIAVRGSLWMKDMLSHPDADSDTDEIYRDILKRYKSHFQAAHNLV
jgi:hypothetical protein